MKKTQLVIFGTGAFYKKRKEKVNGMKDFQICAFLDNNVALWGSVLDGTTIYPPEDLKDIQCDYIVLMSGYKAASEMYEQLIELGLDKSKILYWGEFNAKFSRKRTVFCADNMNEPDQNGKILVITEDIGYHGGSMAAIYAAMSLKSRNYQVYMAAPEGNSKLIDEMNGYGIDVIIYDALPYIKEENWIKEYDAVVVNVFPMIQCACEISRYRPVMWWLHEPSISYEPLLRQFYDYADKRNMQHINICAVSNIAKQNFNTCFSNTVEQILHYGIPDMYDMKPQVNAKKKVIFAVIGAVCENKAQDIFLKAANKIEVGIEAEFWVIGELCKSTYVQCVIELAGCNEHTKIIGVLPREELYNTFSNIDVVVCASREETMSIAITEGMMFGKVCITTDNTGIAEYIKNGENGFVIPTGDVDALHEKMQWIIENKSQISRIGDKARETYEKYFTMEVFGENLDKAVRETVNKWERDTCK